MYSLGVLTGILFMMALRHVLYNVNKIILKQKVEKELERIKNTLEVWQN